MTVFDLASTTCTLESGDAVLEAHILVHYSTAQEEAEQISHLPVSVQPQLQNYNLQPYRKAFDGTNVRRRQACPRVELKVMHSAVRNSAHRSSRSGSFKNNDFHPEVGFNLQSSERILFLYWNYR